MNEKAAEDAEIMNDAPSRIDKTLVKFLAITINDMKPIEARRKAIKEMAERHGGNNRQQFEVALKDEIDRIWIGRKQ